MGFIVSVSQKSYFILTCAILGIKPAEYFLLNSNLYNDFDLALHGPFKLCIL